MAKKEKCSKCGGSLYSVAQDKSNKHYCQSKGCGNVWVPGLEGLQRTDVMLKAALTENENLKLEIARVRAENMALKSKMSATQDGAEIFT